MADKQKHVRKLKQSNQQCSWVLLPQKGGFLFVNLHRGRELRQQREEEKASNSKIFLLSLDFSQLWQALPRCLNTTEPESPALIQLQAFHASDPNPSTAFTRPLSSISPGYSIQMKDNP